MMDVQRGLQMVSQLKLKHLGCKHNKEPEDLYRHFSDTTVLSVPSSKTD